jgi:putative ABC transport system permease protein
MLAFEVRGALRGLARERVYSTVVIATLAVTLGATTAAFSIVNGVLLKPLAYRESQRLVALTEIWRQFADRFPELEVNERHFEYWRTHARSFESLSQYVAGPASLTGVGEAVQITVVHASGSLFDVLRVPAATGRTLSSADEHPGGPRVAVVTDALWRRRLGSDAATVGGTIVLDGDPFTVVGILPPGFQLPQRHGLTAKVDAVVPIRIEEDHVGWAGEHNNDAIGRLREGTTPEQARAELDVLQAQVSELATGEAHSPVTLAASVTPLTEAVVGRARRGLLLLLAAITSVLLIACSNLANLSLNRSLARERDAAIRAALGASRARLLSRAVLEQLLLAAAGGIAGLFVARTAIAAFVLTAPLDLPRAAEVAVDGRALAFAAAVALAAGLAVGAVPAWHLASGDAYGRVRAAGLATTEARGALRARGALLTTQIAASVTLLVVTGLLAVSLMRLLRSDPGFSPRRTLAVDVVLPLRYDESLRAQVSDRVLERVAGLPGVAAAAWTHILPLDGQGTVNFVAPQGDRRPITEQPSANYRYVSSQFFSALSIPLRRGRTFVDADRRLPTVPVVVTESTASAVWPTVDAIGQRFRWTQDPAEKLLEVVGVVPDTKTNVDGLPPLMVYVPFWHHPRSSTSLVVRSSVEPAAMAGAVRRAIAAVDPDIAIATARPMQQLVDSALAGRRYQVRLFLAFGASALLIATVGVYAVTAYGVSRRRREMNIRAALGATNRQVLGLILRQGAAPLAAGIVLGVLGSILAGSAVASQLFEASGQDPRVIAAVAVLVGAVAVGATLTAATRELVLDPGSALREE